MLDDGQLSLFSAISAAAWDEDGKPLGERIYAEVDSGIPDYVGDETTGVAATAPLEAVPPPDEDPWGHAVVPDPGRRLPEMPKPKGAMARRRELR